MDTTERTLNARAESVTEHTEPVAETSITHAELLADMPAEKMKRRRRRIGLAAFFIPFLALWLAYIVQGVFPFGDRHILTIDLYHQYAPFMAEYRRVLLGGGSLFFSWHGGLGIPFYALWAHYLASPFNLLLLFFPESLLTEAVLLISLLKIGLAGYTFAYFLRKRRGTPRTTDLIFSSFYALSGWVLAYSWNIMWLDAVIVLPLIAAALIDLIEHGKIARYVLWLSLLIISNYYMAFFVAIFLVVYFLYLAVNSRVVTSFKTFLKPLGNFIVGSLWAALNSLFIILPVMSQLAETSAVADQFPKPWDMTFLSADFLQRFLPFVAPDIRSGLPNLFGGTLLLLLIPLFFLARKISLKQKISAALVIGFMLISFNLNGLDFIWNGMHYPNQLPYRYAFLLTFFLLTLAAETLPHLAEFSRQTWVGLCFGYGAVLLILQKIDLEKYKHFAVLGVLLLIAIYAVILYLRSNRSRTRAYMETLSFVLVVVAVLELAVNGIFAVNHIATNEYYGSREDYSTGEVVADARELRDTIPTEPFYRETMVPGKSVNNSMLYGLNGATIFSSTMAEEPVKFFKGLGIDTNGINSYEYESGSILLDRIFGIRYRVFRRDAIPEQAYMTKLKQEGNVSLQEDLAAPSPAYFVPERAADFALSDGDMPFAAQNKLARALGAETDIYADVPIEPDPATKGVTVTGGEAHNFHVDLDNHGSPALILKPESYDEGAYFLSWKATSVKVSSIVLKVAGQEINIDSRSEGLADLGKWTAGRDYSVVLNFKEKEGKTGSVKVQLVKADDEALASFTEKLRRGEMRMTVKGASFAGECDCPETGYILLSSPPIDWQVKVNKQPVEVRDLAGGMTLIPVRAGLNTVTAKYTPKGFTVGVLISASAWLLFIALAVVIRRGKRHGEKPDKPKVKRVRRVSLKRSEAVEK